MAEIFGVDENDWCDALKDVLKRLETKQKERDKHGEPRPIMSAPVKLLTVEDTFDRLVIALVSQSNQPNNILRFVPL